MSILIPQSVVIEITEKPHDGLSDWLPGKTLQGYTDPLGNFRPSGLSVNLVIPKMNYKVIKATTPTFNGTLLEKPTKLSKLFKGKSKRKPHVFIPQSIQFDYARMVLAGTLTRKDVATKLNVTPNTVTYWLDKVNDGTYTTGTVYGYKRNKIEGVE